MGYSNVTEEYIVSIKVCSEVEVLTVADSGAIAGMGAFVETGILAAVAGVTVSRLKKRNVVGRETLGGSPDDWDKA